MSPHCDLKLEVGEPVLLHDTLAHDVASPYQVWLKMVEQLSRYCMDKIGHVDRMTDGQTEGWTLIPIHPPLPPPIPGGDIINTN